MGQRIRSGRIANRETVAHYDPLVMASWLYFRDGMSQQEVADRMSVSRASVSNLLAEAKTKGIYSIQFAPDLFDQIGLSQKLKERFGLQSALIVSSAGNAAEVRSRVANAGAWQLRESYRDFKSLGVCWGQTVLELGEQLETGRTALQRVYQMVGIARTDLWKLAEACNSNIASRLSADVMQFPAPGVVSSRELFDQLLEEPIVAGQFDALRKLEAAVFGICSTKPDSPFFASGLATGMSSEILADNEVAGIVGGRMYKLNGEPVVVEGYDDRLLALTMDELRSIPRRLAVAAGLEKTMAIRGALEAGLPTDLATDADTAQALLSD